MRPHVYATVLVTVLLAGCGGAEPAAPAPSGAPSAVPSVVVTPPSSSVAVAESHSLVFTAEGDAEVISIVYSLDGQESTERAGSLPWRKAVEVPADGRQHQWSLTVRHRNGRAELIAIFDGAVVGRSQGAGTGEGTLRVGGSVRG
ncbi:hypothetical protein J2S43_004047 [Catenuloplanes nepalensis]|uniref:Uncharacterized protein n=1 Tax=Catenuloplanes nepalensis TaxID=587533 RepID=A0ABT9MVS5_9ACTN|nr:hypothetical protein [Catenuloplanes nepalensis]MDP9795535.1 hypothetical protein [Catenuloplanes nepalensis]